MRLCLAAVLALCGAPLAADTAGGFDYCVLSLSWSPNWCAIEGDARGSPQCDAAEDFGWTLHGLWPQHETGWPADCLSAFAPPSRRQTEAMAEIIGTSGLAWHQWNRHGTCSGLSPEGYFALARKAYGAIAVPPVFAALSRPVDLPARVVEQAFLADNPGLAPDMITITCDEGYIQEARICLTRDLTPRACGTDAMRDCPLTDARLEPLR